MARRGAAVFVAGDGFNRSFHQVVVVARPDGTRIVLQRPSDTVLAAHFVAYVPGPHGEKTYPNVDIQDVALADDGTPYVTISSSFTGGHSGVEKAPFVWYGAGWRPALSSRLPTDATNLSIAAADAPTVAAYNSDYLNYGPADSARRIERPQYHAQEVLLAKGSGKYLLGQGTGTGMHGGVVVGYATDVQADGSARPTAMAWQRGRSQRLGDGIAWSVNASSDVVGDDRTRVDRAGHPVLWHAGHMVRLSRFFGSAFAINDDGIIVGDSQAGSFVVRPAGKSHVVLWLDSLLHDRRWHIVHAFGISSSGDILCIATDQRHRTHVVVLRGR
jgi:uncharacterized membrane protein